MESRETTETKFLAGLIKLNYGENVLEELKLSSRNISWVRGWPENNESFWNAEAFMWNYKIDKSVRALIKKELSFLKGKNNLDLGCGAYSYIPSVGFDFSEKMLDFNENCLKKVKGNLEKNLPFKKEEFDSVTAVFVLNYIKNYKYLLLEIKRILRNSGYFVTVFCSKNINVWQKQKEVNKFSSDELAEIIKNKGFEVSFCEKQNLCFFVCRKQKDY